MEDCHTDHNYSCEMGSSDGKYYFFIDEDYNCRGDTISSYFGIYESRPGGMGLNSLAYYDADSLVKLFKEAKII